jgi:hypothetical protein
MLQDKPAKTAEEITAGATKWMMRFNAILAFLTLVVLCLQLNEIHEGGSDTHKLAESTLAASRAWVVVQGTGFEFTKDTNYPRGRVVLEDSGNSPAFGIDGWRCVEVRHDEPPMQGGQLQESPTAVCLPIAGGTLGRGIPITINGYVRSPVSTTFSQDTQGMDEHFYFWGTVTYDIYPSDGKRHSTSFCLRNGGDQLSACQEGGHDAN